MTAIRHPQAKRKVKPFGITEAMGYRFKGYGVMYAPSRQQGIFLDGEHRKVEPVLRQVVSQVPTQFDSHNVGFFILHAGEHATWLLCDWWGEECILFQRLFRKAHGVEIFEPFRHHIIGCTWELAVIAHEGDAWSKHVLYNDRCANIDAYLDDSLAGYV